MTLSNNQNNNHSNSSEPSSHYFDYALLFHQQQEQLVVSVGANISVKNNNNTITTDDHHSEQASSAQQGLFDVFEDNEDEKSDVREDADSQQQWMNNMMTKKKGDYLRIGEEISFYTDLSSKSTGNSMIGFLSVDGINLTCSENIKGNKAQARCGLVESVVSEKESSFFTPNFSNCIFKICHPKSYSALKKFKNFKEEQELKEANKKVKDNKNNVLPSTASFSTEYQQLEQRAERELEQNKMESQRNLSKPVVYGQTVQLFHVQTQCYLTVARESAEMQKDCMRLALDKEGSTYSYFQIMPYSNFQKDGDQVKLTDQIRLYNKKSNQFIHLSYYRYTTGETNDGTYQRANENSSYTEVAQQAVKLSRSRGKYSYDNRREVNVANSTSFTRWRMKLYTKYTPQTMEETNRKLKAGTIMRIYHKEFEGYIGVNEKTDRIKFFKKLSTLHIGSESSMESKNDYVSPQTLWQLEFLDSSCSGTVKWTSKFRLRHLASGKYMIVRPIKGITIEADDMIEERYERESSPTMGGNLSQLGANNTSRKSSVVATPRGNRSGSVTQINDSLWTLHVESFDDLITQPLPTSVFYFTDSTGGQKKAEKVQSTDYFRLKHEATNSWVHISRALADSTYQRVTSSLKMFEQDVFNFSAVSSEDLNDALTVASYMPIIRYFKSKLDDSLVEKSDIKLYVGVLSNCIRFCTISEETDPLTRGGIPVKSRQNIIRDMGVIDLIIENITLLLKKYLSIEDLYLIYEKPEKSLYFDVVQYSFRLIRQFVLSNEANGLYMAQYINFIQSLIEHSIAASEALLEILSNNYPLLNKITESQIDFFVKLLFENNSKIGMKQSSKSLKKAVYLSFLSSLIICEGKTVVKNQVYIGNLLFVKYKDQLRRVFIIPKLNNEDKVVVEVNHDEIDLISFSQSATDDTYTGYVRPNYEQLIFFQEEIRLFAALCTGKNEEIEDARRSVVSLFTYEVVHKCVSDKNLTPAVRTSFVKLLIQTFIDTEKREKKPLIDYTRKTSTLNQRAKEEGSRDLIEIKDFLAKFLKENESLDMSLEKRDHSIFTLYVVIMCKRMLEFGVFTLIDFEEGDLLNSLFDMLRGDNDKKDGRILSEEERHKNVEENLTIMNIKIEIASIFHMILDIILDKRVTKFLQFFWKKYREEEIEAVLREQEVIPMDNRALQQRRLAEIDSNEYAVIKDILEKDVIFNRMDRFDVKILSLTKYENKELATTCLDLLIRKYRSAQELCEVLPKIELIVSREMAKSYDLLLSQVVELRSVFGYGQSAYFGTRRLTEQEEKKVLKALNEILSDIKKNGQRSQRIVRNLFIYDIILTFLKKDYIVSKEIEEIGIDILIAFVRGNQDNQKIMFKQLEFFIHTIGENRSLDKKIVILLCEMVRDNRGLCSTIEEKLVEHYIDQIAEQTCSFMLLFLHVILGTNNGNPIKRNQSLITKYLLERKKDIMILFKDEEGLRERNQRIIKGEHKTEPDGILNYHIALLYLLASLADGKNRESELKLQTLYSYEELLEQVVSPYTLPVLRNPLVKVIDEIYLNVENASDDSTESQSKMVNVHHPMIFKLFTKMVIELEVLEMTYANELDGNDLVLSTQKGERQSIMHAHTRTPTTPSKALSNTSLFATPTKNRALSSTASKRSSNTYSVALPKALGPTEEDQEIYQVDNTYLFDIMIPCVRDYFHLHFPPPNLTKEQMDIAEDLLLKLIELHKHTPNPENRDKVHKCIQAMLKRSMSATSQKAISNFISNKATKAKVQRSRIQTSTSTEKDELIHNTYKKYLKDRIISKITRNFSNFAELAAIFIKYDGFIKTLVNVLRDLNSSGLLLQNMKVGLFGMDILKTIVESQNQQTEESTLKLDLVEKKIPEVVIEFMNSNHHQIIKSSLELGILILNDGDLDVQNHIYSLLTEGDTTEFFMSVRDRIRLSKIEIKQMKNHLKKKRDKELALANQKKSTNHLAIEQDSEEDEIVGVEFIEKGFILNTMEFLRLLCEGHNVKNQALLKHQPRNIFSFDLISEIIEYLITLEKKLDSDNVQIAIQGFKTLTEFVQGPAVFNQNLVGTSNKIYPRLINEIMSKSYDDSKLLKEQELNLKKEITLFLISLLEGRNTVTLEFMKNSLNLDDFEQKLLYILRLFETLSGNNHDECDDLERLKKRMRKDFGFHVLYQEKSSKKPIRVDDYMEDNLEKIRLQYEDLGTHIYFLLSMIRDSETNFRKSGSEEESRVANFFQTNLKELSYFKQRTGSIEVLRNNALEKIYFPKPTICNNIIDKARSNYANSLHVMTPQEKVRKLYNDTFSRFYVEMCHYENMKKTFTIPSLNRKIEEEPEDEIDNLLPSMSLVATTGNLLAKRKKKKKQEVKTASWEYIASWWDYLRLSSFFLAVIINIIVLGTFKRIYATTDYSQIPLPGSDFDVTALAKITAPRNLASDIILIIIGVTQLIFLLVLFVIYVSLFLTLEVKKRFKMKKNETWDSIPRNLDFITKCFLYTMQDSQIWYFIIYIVVSVIGLLITPIIYSIQLFEMVYIFKSLTDVLKSVTSNVKRLFFTGMLLCIALFFFGTLYFTFFSSDFKISKTGDKTCEDMLACYVTMLDYGFRGESFWEDIYSPNVSVQRAILDLSFLAIVIVLLVNVVFGVILDSFEVLRNEREERKKDIRDKCFICGLERTKFDTRANEGITFEKHVKEEHYLWNYVYFLIYLYQKSVTEFTGTEQYIYDRCEDNDDVTSFFPIFRSLALEQTTEQSSSIE